MAAPSLSAQAWGATASILLPPQGPPNQHPLATAMDFQFPKNLAGSETTLQSELFQTD